MVIEKLINYIYSWRHGVDVMKTHLTRDSKVLSSMLVLATVHLPLHGCWNLFCSTHKCCDSSFFSS